MTVHPIESRYYRPEMKRIFEEEHKLQKWLEVEASLARAHAEVGNIPKKAAEEISKKASTKHVKLDRVKEIESEIRHDLMSMVRALSEVCEGDAGKYVHLGVTSYDIEDTALALQLKEVLSIIKNDLLKLKKILVELAEKHKKTICVGRTHGQHAVPTTYGMKFAVWACEIQRHLERINGCSDRLLVGKMSGAVGTMASLGEKGPAIQESVMKDLGLKPVLVSTQVVQRDRQAELFTIIALIAMTLEKIAKEIRNLQRTEIGEVSEPFKTKQVGSSTMPHKRNPHRSERICGLARVIKSNLIPALDNIPLEHERDLTDSSCERVIIPEFCILIDYMLAEMMDILEGLEISKERIEQNLRLTRGLWLTEHLMMKLVEKGMGRREAHEVLRECSMIAFKKGSDLKDVLIEDKRVLDFLTLEEIEWCLKPENYIGKAVPLVENVLKTLKGD